MSSHSVRACLRTIASGQGFERRDEELDSRTRATQAAAASPVAYETHRESQSPGGLR
jgi:hypothetical protein